MQIHRWNLLVSLISSVLPSGSYGLQLIYLRYLVLLEIISFETWDHPAAVTFLLKAAESLKWMSGFRVKVQSFKWTAERPSSVKVFFDDAVYVDLVLSGEITNKLAFGYEERLINLTLSIARWQKGLYKVMWEAIRTLWFAPVPIRAIDFRERDKHSWKISQLYDLSSRHPNKIRKIAEIKVREQTITESSEIAEELNLHFSSVGEKLASEILSSNVEPEPYLEATKTTFYSNLFSERSTGERSPQTFGQTEWKESCGLR